MDAEGGRRVAWSKAGRHKVSNINTAGAHLEKNPNARGGGELHKDARGGGDERHQKSCPAGTLRIQTSLICSKTKKRGRIKSLSLFSKRQGIWEGLFCD